MYVCMYVSKFVHRKRNLSMIGPINLSILKVVTDKPTLHYSTHYSARQFLTLLHTYMPVCQRIFAESRISSMRCASSQKWPAPTTHTHIHTFINTYMHTYILTYTHTNTTSLIVFYASKYIHTFIQTDTKT